MDFYMQNGFKGLDELAERLGVSEASGNCLLTTNGLSGKRYDVIELVHALLDRLDAKPSSSN
jgi:hypothetical protein